MEFFLKPTHQHNDEHKLSSSRKKKIISCIKNSSKTFANLIESIDFHIKCFINKKECMWLLLKKKGG